MTLDKETQNLVLNQIESPVEYEITFSHQGTEHTLTYNVGKGAQNVILLTTP